MRRITEGTETAGGLAVVGFAACFFGSAALSAGPDAAARSCPDARVPLNTSVGGTPIASLTVGGKSGWFLIDSGASLSAVDTHAYGLAAGAAVELSPPFCAPRKSVFRAEDMGSFAAPAGGQRGRIGTDILAGFAVTFSYAGPAPGMTVHAGSLDPAALTAAGFVEIDRPGYYGAAASDRLPGSTGVPVIGLAIGSVAVPAQLDTGFDDARDPGIVQGNAALMAELRQNDVAMHPVPAGSTLGCAGPRPYPRWRIDSAALVVVRADGTPAKAYPAPLLEIKDDVVCGGIAAFSKPFAQIGASWLGRWRTTILDGAGGRIWIPR